MTPFSPKKITNVSEKTATCNSHFSTVNTETTGSPKCRHTSSRLHGTGSQGIIFLGIKFKGTKLYMINLEFSEKHFYRKLTFFNSECGGSRFLEMSVKNFKTKR
jgi:hypothetical protein